MAFAAGRISVLMRDKLDDAKLERLMGTATLAEATRVLQEFGWAGEIGEDYEQLAARHAQQAYAFVHEVTPNQDVTDCFLIRLDIHNLKMLLKARCLGQPAAYLMASGLYAIEDLHHMTEERRYRALPAVLAEPLDALEKRLAVREDPMDIDVSLDQAMYAFIFAKLKDAHAPVIRQYFAGKVDMTNAVTLLRTLRMDKDSTFFAPLIIDGGSIGVSQWLAAMQQPEQMPRMLSRYGVDVVSAAQAAVQDGPVAALEKAMDDYLMKLFVPHRHDVQSIEPVIGYLLTREREAAAVRLILAGKANGFPPEAVRERLRELYA